jgi:hypothetical protein
MAIVVFMPRPTALGNTFIWITCWGHGAASFRLSPAIPGLSN